MTTTPDTRQPDTPDRTKRTPEQLAELKAAICELKAQAFTFREIADQLDISRQHAHDMYWAAIRETPATAVNEIRAQQNARLDWMTQEAAKIFRKRHVYVSGGKVVHQTEPVLNEDGTVARNDEYEPLLQDLGPLEDDGPKLKALAELRAIEAERSRLNGTYAPVQAVINGEVRYEVAGIDLDALR